MQKKGTDSICYKTTVAGLTHTDECAVKWKVKAHRGQYKCDLCFMQASKSLFLYRVSQVDL